MRGLVQRKDWENINELQKGSRVAENGGEGCRENSVWYDLQPQEERNERQLIGTRRMNAL